MDDLGLAFSDLHVSLNELCEYLRNVDFPASAPKSLYFPEEKASSVVCNEHDYRNESMDTDGVLLPFDAEGD